MTPIHFRVLAPAFGAFMMLATTANSAITPDLPADADLECVPIAYVEADFFYNLATEQVSYNPTNKSEFDGWNSQINSMTETEKKQELSKAFEEIKQGLAIKVRTTDNGLKVKLLNEGSGDVQDFTWIHADTLGLGLLGIQTDMLNLYAGNLFYELQSRMPSTDGSEAELNKLAAEAANILMQPLSEGTSVRLNVDFTNKQKAHLTLYPDGMFSQRPNYAPSVSYECEINSF